MIRNLAKTFAAAMLLVPMSAFAAPVTVDFTVHGVRAFTDSEGGNATSYNGHAVANAIGTGWFTIDDSIGNFGNYVDGLVPIDFHLDFAGVSITETEARLYTATFADFGLDSWLLGRHGVDDCGWNCVSSGGPLDFWIAGTSGSGGVGDTSVHQAGVSGWMIGSFNWTVRTTPVPEPATLSLLGMGLLGAFGLRRRRLA